MTYKDALDMAISMHIEAICKHTEVDTELFDKELPEFYSKLLLAELADHLEGDQAKDFFAEYGIDGWGEGKDAFQDLDTLDFDDLKEMLVDCMSRLSDKFDLDDEVPDDPKELAHLAVESTAILVDAGKNAFEGLIAAKHMIHNDDPDFKMASLAFEKGVLDPFLKTLSEAHANLFGKREEEMPEKIHGPNGEVGYNIAGAVKKMDMFLLAFATQLDGLTASKGYKHEHRENFWANTMFDMQKGFENMLVAKNILSRGELNNMLNTIGTENLTHYFTGLCAIYTGAILHKEPTTQNVISGFTEQFCKYLDGKYPSCRGVEALEPKIELAYAAYVRKQDNRGPTKYYEYPDFPDLE